VDGSRFGQGRTQREEMRSALGFGDELVVVYCGSIHRWQCPEASIEAFKTMHQVVTNSRLLILTRQTERMLTLLREKGVEPEAYTVTTVPHADVPSYLAAADVGLLLREPSVVNRVAAPIKFAEYAAAGVPVLISDGVGDYSDHVRKEKLGLIEGGDDNGFVDWLQDVRAHRSAWAERCAAFAERELAWQSRIADVVDFHRALAAQDMTTHD
jgi:glycosyltransferase involved in cell wall biosynthesis